MTFVMRSCWFLWRVPILSPLPLLIFRNNSKRVSIGRWLGSSALRPWWSQTSSSFGLRRHWFRFTGFGDQIGDRCRDCYRVGWGRSGKLTGYLYYTIEMNSYSHSTQLFSLWDVIKLRVSFTPEKGFQWLLRPLEQVWGGGLWDVYRSQYYLSRSREHMGDYTQDPCQDLKHQQLTVVPSLHAPLKSHESHGWVTVNLLRHFWSGVQKSCSGYADLGVLCHNNVSTSETFPGPWIWR